MFFSKKKLIILFFIITGVLDFFAQQKYEFKQLTSNGIYPNSITYSVKQDSVGDIWIATEDGILKYNSHFFVLYNTQKGLPALASNRATEIFIDSRQRIWAGLEKGVCLFDLKENRFKFLDKEKIHPKFLSTIAEDGKHNIWFSSTNGLWKYSAQGQLVHVDRANNIKALNAIGNKIYFGTSSGLYYLDIKNNIVKNIQLPENESDIAKIIYSNRQIFVTNFSGSIYTIDSISQKANLLPLKIKINKPVFDIVVDKQHNYFVATNGEGLFYFDNNFHLKNHFVNDIDIPGSIKSDGIYDLEIGRENILWIATYGGGLNYLDLNQSPFVKIQHIINNSNSIIANYTTAIEKDKYNRLWFATNKGISIWDRKNNKWFHISDFSGQSNDDQVTILSLEADNDFMWAGSYGGGVFKININTLKHENINKKLPDITISKIYAITRDQQENIWLGGINQPLTQIKKNNEIKQFPVYDVKTIVLSKQGDILAGSKEGLFIIKSKTGEILSYTDIIPRQTISHTKINAIVPIDKNNLILGTGGTGLIFFNLQTKKKYILDVNKGLSSNIVQGILLQDKNNFWVSTSKGINHIIIKPNDTLIYLYDKNDNLTGNEYIPGSSIKISDSLMAFGSINGVSMFNPFLIKEKAQTPTIVFDEFMLYGNDETEDEIIKNHINEIDHINLKSDQNSFIIKFSGVHLRHPSKIKYTWKLEGFTNKWSQPGTNSVVNFTNLNPGTYVFKVKAFNRYGDSSPVKQLKINISPPWWATKIAYFLFLILFVLLIYFAFWLYKIYLNKKHSEEQITFFNNITHELKTPLIVLLSSLEKISAQFGETYKDNKYLVRNIKKINALFEQMLNYQRVAHEKIFGEEINKINVEQLIQKMIESFKPLIQKRNLQVIVRNKWGDKDFYFNREIFEKIIQNLLSNAIKYSFDNGKIFIEIKRKQQRLIFEIADHGIGIPKDQQKNILKKYFRARNVINSHISGTGLGLIMIKKMIDQVNGKITFTSEENKGTKFVVQLNSNKEAYIKSLSENKKETAIKNMKLPSKQKLLEFSESKILVVEDSYELRKKLVNILKDYFIVYEAVNGEEGLQKAKEIVPDIILTDLIMPKMDGIEMAQRIQSDINLNHIPIFMMTVMSKSGYQLKSVEAGIDAYIEKPLDINLLLSRIINTLERQNKLKKRFQQKTESEMAYQYRNQKDQEFVEKIKQIILENLDNNGFSVSDITSQLAMSRTSLYLKIKKIIDMSPQEFIVQIRLEQAKKLLIEGGLSIKQIAYSVGFSNSKYFSTVFKKYYGISPSEFLKKLNKN